MQVLQTIYLNVFYPMPVTINYAVLGSRPSDHGFNPGQSPTQSIVTNLFHTNIFIYIYISFECNTKSCRSFLSVIQVQGNKRPQVEGKHVIMSYHAETVSFCLTLVDVLHCVCCYLYITCCGINTMKHNAISTTSKVVGIVKQLKTS